MPKTHQQVLVSFESKLFEAMIAADIPRLLELIHPDHVLVNESGVCTYGVLQLEITVPEILRVESIELLERQITLFNNVAVINTIETRTGFYRSLYFERECRITRIWKFDGLQWQLIGTTVVLP